MTHVCVIGGGVVGVTTAHYLSEASHEVTVLERGKIASEASYGNGGLIVPSRCIPIASPEALKLFKKWAFRRNSPVKVSLRPSPRLLSWIRRFYKACKSEEFPERRKLLKAMGDKSLELFQEFGRQGLPFDFEQKGVLDVFSDESNFSAARKSAEELSDQGFRLEVLSRNAAIDKEPTLSKDIVGGILHPTDAQGNSFRFTHALAERNSAKGVKLVEETEAQGFEGDGKEVRAVKVDGGQILCDVVIITAGPWSPALTRLLGEDIPIQPGKGYMAVLDASEPRLNTAIDAADSHVMATQMTNGDLKVVSTLEFSGFNKSIGRARIDWMIGSLSRILPGTKARKIKEVWSGLRPCAPDGLPLIGRVKGYSNVYVAAGHCRLGFMLAPITGKLISEMLTNKETTIPVDKLSPSRFT